MLMSVAKSNLKSNSLQFKFSSTFRQSRWWNFSAIFEIMLRLLARSTARASSTITKQLSTRNLHHVAKHLTSVSISNSHCTLRADGIATFTTDNGPNAKNRPSKTVQWLSANTVSLPYETFHTIRTNLTQPGAVTVDNGFAIMRSCSQLIDRSVNERALLVHTVWTKLVQLIGTPNKNQVICLIDAFRRSGKVLGDHMKFLERYQIELDADIYERLVYWSCQNDHNLESTEQLIEEMQHKGFEPTEMLFNALIVGSARNGLNAIEDALIKMQKANIKPSNETYKQLIIAYLRNNETNKAMETFTNNFQRFADYNTDQLYAIIRAAVAQQCEPLIIAAIDQLPESIKNAKSLAEGIQNICTEMVHLNKARELDARMDPYELIIQHFPAPTHEYGVTDEYGSFLIREMIAINQTPDDIFKFCQQLRDSQRNPRALHFCCISALAHKRSLAVDAMRQINRSESLRPHYLWPLFIQASDYEQVLKVLEFAVETKTSLDVQTLYEYVLPRMPSMNYQEMVKILTKHDVKMNELKSAMIAFLLNEKRPEEAKQLARQSKAYVDQIFILEPLIGFVRHHKFGKNEYTIVELVDCLQRSKKYEVNYDLAGQLLYAIAVSSSNKFDLVKRLAYNYQKIGVKISPNMADLISMKLYKDHSAYDELNPILSSMIDGETFPEIHEKQKAVEVGTRLQQLEQELSEFESNKFPTHGKTIFCCCKKFPRKFILK